MTGASWWSQTAGSNANGNGDAQVNFAEGQAPSSVNDSARAAMASIAKWRDDISCGTSTGGGGNAYTLSTYQVFDSLSRAANQLIGFRSNNTNTGASTFSLDGLGAKPLRIQSGVDIPAGTILAGSPYQVVYNLADDVFYLVGIVGQPYSIPIGGMIDFTGTAAPNSAFVFPYGQAISRTTYATLFSLVGTTYGPGDGTTTFNIIDLRGRVTAGKDDMGGSVSSPARLTSTYFGAVTGGTGTTLGAVGGLESHTLTTAQLASHNHTATSTDAGHTHGYTRRGGVTHQDGTNAATVATQDISDITNTGSANITTTINNSGGGGAHNNVQPTIIVNKLLRIL